MLRSIALYSNFNRVIGPTEPTRIDSTAAGRDDVLYVLIVNNYNGVMPISVVHNELTSDHLPVVTDLLTNVHA